MWVPLAVGFVLGWLAKGSGFSLNPSDSDFVFSKLSPTAAKTSVSGEDGVFLIAFQDPAGRRKFMTGANGSPQYWSNRKKAQQKASMLAAGGVRVSVVPYGPKHNPAAITLAQ